MAPRQVSRPLNRARRLGDRCGNRRGTVVHTTLDCLVAIAALAAMDTQVEFKVAYCRC